MGQSASWCESVLWRSPEWPLSPQFVLCPLETGSDQGGVLHRPCPPGDRAETHGQLAAQKLRQKLSDFWVDFSKVRKWRNVEMQYDDGSRTIRHSMWSQIYGKKKVSNLILWSVHHSVKSRFSQTHKLLILTSLKPENTKPGCCSVIRGHVSDHSHLESSLPTCRHLTAWHNSTHYSSVIRLRESFRSLCRTYLWTSCWGLTWAVDVLSCDFISSTAPPPTLTWQVGLSSIFFLMKSSTWRTVASPDTRTYGLSNGLKGES